MPAKAEDASVLAFKHHLANPPCFSRILYSEVSCTDVTARTFYAGYCGDSFFLRQLTGFEDFIEPITETNRNRSPLYVGSLGDTRWQIAGYQLSLSIKPDPVHPDRYAALSDGMQIFLGEVLNFGSQHVQPGSFVWTGNRFKAEPSQSARQQGLGRVEGEITIQDGAVASMLVEGSGWWQYKYSNSTNLPSGVPTEIKQIGMDSSSNIICIKKLVIHQMVPGNRSEELLLFDPKTRIEPKLTILNVWSNSIQIVKPASNERVTAIVKEELEKKATPSKDRATAKYAVRLLLLICGVGFPLFLIFKRVSRHKGHP